MKLFGMYSKNDRAILSDKDSFGKEFTSPAEACEWALKNLPLPQDGQDREWYIDVTIDNIENEEK